MCGWKTSEVAAAPKYKLKFVPQALEEWKSLDGSVKPTLKKALEKRLDNPHVPASRLHGELSSCYKIKLLRHGVRLVYEVEDDVLIVMVLAIDRRDNNAAYRAALDRLQKKAISKKHE